MLNRLKGACCDQKPCRFAALNPEISHDGQKIVFISDVNYEGAGGFPARPPCRPHHHFRLVTCKHTRSMHCRC